MKDQQAKKKKNKRKRKKKVQQVFEEDKQDHHQVSPLLQDILRNFGEGEDDIESKIAV